MSPLPSQSATQLQWAGSASGTRRAEGQQKRDAYEALAAPEYRSHGRHKYPVPLPVSLITAAVAPLTNHLAGNHSIHHPSRCARYHRQPQSIFTLTCIYLPVTIIHDPLVLISLLHLISIPLHSSPSFVTPRQSRLSLHFQALSRLSRKPDLALFSSTCRIMSLEVSSVCPLQCGRFFSPSLAIALFTKNKSQP